MTGSTGILSESERVRIAQAVGRAEAGTAGEIVVLVAARAGLYRSPALALALAVALALPWPLILLTHLSASEIALTQAGGVLAALAATLNERVRIFLTPRPWRHERARAAARHEFVAHGLTATRGRTGVLIYVALAERYAEIVADTGVEARVPEERWQTILTGLLAAAGRGALADGLVTAVMDVGGLLAVKLPEDGARDELPNRVIVLN